MIRMNMRSARTTLREVATIAVARSVNFRRGEHGLNDYYYSAFGISCFFFPPTDRKGKDADGTF
jgi:hypothetical protein